MHGSFGGSRLAARGSRLALAIAILGPLVAATDACAQALRPYRVILLKDSGGTPVNIGAAPTYLTPNDPYHFTFGISDSGLVCGFYDADPSDEGGAVDLHGFVWLPSNMGFGSTTLPIRTLIDLNNIALPSGSTDQTIANDVNDLGVIVGLRGSDVATSAHATAFPMSISASTIGAVDLHTQPVIDGDFSVAFGLNDESYTRIVGGAVRNCSPESDLPSHHVGFVTSYSSWLGAGTMSILTRPGSSVHVEGTGIGKTSYSSISGKAEGLDTDEDLCNDEFPGLTCLITHFEHPRWDASLGLPDLVPGIDSDSGVDGGMQGRGVNDDGDHCGYGYKHTTFSQCKRRATLWDGVSVATSVPGDVMPHLAEGNESWAEAVTPRGANGCRTIVGLDLDEGSGVIWYGSYGGWCAERLSDLILPCHQNVVVKGAYDINRHRIIVAWVAQTIDGITRPHAAVLTSAADYNGDLRVNGADRALLMANYCSSGCTTAQLEYDLNCDAAVNASDLALFATYYSGNNPCTVPTICECGIGTGSFAASAESIVEPALAYVGFESWEELSVWLMTTDEATADSVFDVIAILLSGE